VVRNPSSPFGRLLNSLAMVHVGVVSYSLYLWQELFLKTAGRPSNILLGAAYAFVAAEASYRLIETRFLRLRTRLAARRPGPKGLSDSNRQRSSRK